MEDIKGEGNEEAGGTTSRCRDPAVEKTKTS